MMNARTIRSLLLFAGICFLLAGCTPTQERRVLVVHSYEESYPGYPEFNNLIEQQFHKKGIHPDIRTVYLDCESYSEQRELEHMSHLLDSVSADWTPEVILVNEDQATYSLLKCGHPLARQVPVVFAGVNYPNETLLKKCSNVTGFRDKLDVITNINIAKKLFGEKTSLFTILDSTYLDRQIRADTREQVKGARVLGFMNDQAQNDSIRAKKGYTPFLAVGMRLAPRAGMGPDGQLMWSMGKFFRNQYYLQLKRDFTTVNVGSISTRPNLTAINEGFGFGEKLLGGYFTTLPIQVEDQVGAAVRIFNGEKPSDIPITDSRKAYTFDWRVMEPMGISVSQIPSGYNIINIPWRKVRPVLWGVLLGVSCLIVVTIIVCLFLLYQREQKRKRMALHDLADEKQTLSLAIEGSDTYAWKYEDDRFIFEKAFWESLNIPARKLSFEEFLPFVHPDDTASVRANWDKTKVHKRIAQMRCDFDGQGYQWWEFRYTTVLFETDGYKTAGLLLNIQEVKDREEELDTARLLAEKAELKQSFLANMSHEIRTPLNAIVGFSNILTSDEDLDPEDKQVYIETINRNNDLLLKLINDILEISRIESGSMSFEFEHCLISTLVDNIYRTHQVLIPGHLEFLRETDPARIEIHADVGRLTQVITNFLNNAGKFTASGHIKLGYRHMPDTSQVCIYVEDTGCGIPPEAQKMIFSRFYKQDEFSQGTGLGLSICQVIVEKLGGEIRLESEQGKGSRFMLLLPCRIVEA